MTIPQIRTLESIEQLNELHERTELQGLFHVSNDDYHKGPGVSSSQLKKFLNVPAESLVESESNDNFDFGNAFHTKVLEPHKFDDEVAVMPKIDKRTKAGKEAFKAFEEANKGKLIITEENKLALDQMEANINIHPKCKTYLSDGHKELAAYHYDEETGELIKAKCDILHIGKETVFADLKTTVDANPDSILWHIKRYKYQLSAAMYCDIFSKVLGQDIDLFVLIFCGKSKPHQVETGYLGPNLMEQGFDLYRKCLLEYKAAKDLDYYPSSTNQLHCWEIN